MARGRGVLRSFDVLSPTEQALAAGVCIGFLGVLVWEEASHGFRHFWGARPLEAGIASTLLLAALGTFFLRAYREKQRQRQWKFLHSVAFGALSGEHSPLIDAMNSLVTGYEAPAEIARVQASLVGGPWQGDPHGLPHDESVRRVRALATSDEWRQIATRTIAAQRAAHRELFPKWSPTALLAPGPFPAVLGRLSRLNDLLRNLEDWLRRADASDAEEVTTYWHLALAELLSAREDLIRVARGTLSDSWVKFRSPAPDAARKQMEHRAGTGAPVEWAQIPLEDATIPEAPERREPAEAGSRSCNRGAQI